MTNNKSDIPECKDELHKEICHFINFGLMTYEKQRPQRFDSYIHRFAHNVEQNLFLNHVLLTFKLYYK